ncbi:hypothetical protein C8J56DRAFT_1065174 [Mycena floridula]|nr:hypothetical protein C8J56DRAFT_1065174 [Mycena floridula]
MGISPGLQSLLMMPSVHTEYSSYSDDDECPPTEVINPYPPVAFSPCPSLTYSPSSSDSSSGGDRTIQMSSFSDDGMFGVNMGAPVKSETCLYRQFSGPVKASGAIPFRHNPRMISWSQDTQIQRFDIGQEYLASKYSVGIDHGSGGIWNTESFWG